MIRLILNALLLTVALFPHQGSRRSGQLRHQERAMKQVRVIALAFAATLLSVGTAAADDTYLTGLRVFDVVVETVNPNSCGITESDVTTSLKYVLSQSRLKIATTASGYVYLNVTVLDDCSAASIRLAIEQPSTIKATNRFALGVIWEKSVLLGGRSDMSRRITNEVERMGKAFIVAWSSTNP